MANFVSLENLVHAIAGSIMEAQHLVEKAQISNIGSYFNENKQPISLDIELPSLRQDGEYDLHRLPLISLIPHSSLVISEAEIELDVELNGIQETPRVGANATLMDQAQTAAPAENKLTLMVSAEGGGIGKKNGNAAHITLKLASAENAEGMERLLTEVIKGQGHVGAASSSNVPPESEA